MTGKIKCKSDDCHTPDEREKHSRPLVVFGQCFQSCVDHYYNANEREDKHHPLLHHRGLLNLRTKVDYISCRNHENIDIKLRGRFIWASAQDAANKPDLESPICIFC